MCTPNARPLPLFQYEMMIVKMVQIILVRVKIQVYSYLFETLELSAHQANEVLHMAGRALQDLIKEEMVSGKIDGVVADLTGEGFLDLFRTPFAIKFRQKLSEYFTQQTSIEKNKINLMVLIISPYFLSELARQIKKNLDEEGNPQLLSVVGISS